MANLQAMESPSDDEYYVEAAVNAKGPNFIEIKVLLNNRSGWPARADSNLSIRCFFDISELLANGASPSDLTLTSNYSQGSKASGPSSFNGSPTRYYVTLDFAGAVVYPGGQSAYRKEVQFRIAGPQNTSYFDPANDWSFDGVATNPASPARTDKIPVYRDGVRIYGAEPAN